MPAAARPIRVGTVWWRGRCEAGARGGGATCGAAAALPCGVGRCRAVDETRAGFKLRVRDSESPAGRDSADGAAADAGRRHGRLGLGASRRPVRPGGITTPSRIRVGCAAYENFPILGTVRFRTVPVAPLLVGPSGGELAKLECRADLASPGAVGRGTCQWDSNSAVEWAQPADSEYCGPGQPDSEPGQNGKNHYCWDWSS